MKDVIEQIEGSRQDLQKTLEQQIHVLEDIERAQRKLVVDKDSTIRTIATLRGALQAYEQSLILIKKAEGSEPSEETGEDA